MDHYIYVSGGFDYDFDVACTCGTAFGNFHGPIPLPDLIEMTANHEHQTEGKAP